MQRIIGELYEYRYSDVDDTCDECGEATAKWYGMVFRGTSYEPTEYVYLCDKDAGYPDE